jgi:hypothetical protein
MTVAQTLWVISGVTAFMVLPVGAIRMVAYRSREVDHTPALRGVALTALGLGAAGLVLFVGLTLWFVSSGNEPW